jgi:hypothetical protein
MIKSFINKSIRVIQPNVKIRNKNIDLSKYVKVIETYKNLKQPAGTFFIELSTASSKDNITSYNVAENLYNNIDPMDIIEIGITEPGLMVGLVDSPNKSKSISTTGFSRNLQVTGRDFAKLLIEDSIVYSPQILNNKNAAKILGEERLAFIGQLTRGRNSQLFNNPICALLFILRNIPAVHVEVPFTDLSNGISKTEVTSGKLGQYFICDLKSFLGDRVSDTLMSQFSGKIWNYLMLCIDENFYELYVDTVTAEGASGKESRPCLFLRPKPYDRTTDNVIKIKEVYSSSTAPAFQAVEAAGALASKVTGEDETGKAKAIAAGKEVMKNLINFNKVIYPRAEMGDLVFLNKGGGGSANTTGGPEGGGSSNGVTTYVSISGMDKDGNIPEPPPPRFMGERDVSKPNDPSNLSIIIPWTWDGADSFYRTMVTNEQYHVIHDEDIIQESLGTSDYEVIDYISVRSRKDMEQDPSKSLTGYSYPLMDGYKIRKFGLRSFDVESNLLHTSYKLTASEAQNYKIAAPEKNDIFSSTEYVNNRERLFNWYRYNDIMESGILIIKGNQDIRIGDKIYMPDAVSKGGNLGIYAYVQGVKNRYEYTQTGVKFETTLEIIRGENPDDIEAYRSQTNSGSGGNIKYGSTYRNYDEALGQISSGSPEDPGSHNIIKYDVVQNITDLDSEKKDLQTPQNASVSGSDYSVDVTKQNSLKPRFSGYVSPDADDSRTNLTQMQGETEKPFKSFSSEVSGQIEGGFGTNANSQSVEINGKVFQFLEAIGSSAFPFQIELKTIVSSQAKNIENNPKKQLSPLGLGNAVEIAADGSAGSEDYIKKTQALLTYILGLKDDDGNIPDNPLKPVLDSRGLIPKIVIACPNQNENDLKLCLGISQLTDEMKSGFKDRIQLVF